MESRKGGLQLTKKHILSDEREQGKTFLVLLEVAELEKAISGASD